jgi:hypothetical protein
VTMATDIEQDVDISDLSLLDDGNAHARCTFCQPVVRVMEPFVALCGTRAVYLNPDADPLVVPLNACGSYADLWDVPCARCGAL